MGIDYAVSNSVDTAVVTTAETVVATLSGVSSQRAGQAVTLRGDITIATGAGTTALTLRVRRDGLTGTVVDEAPVPAVQAAAGSVETQGVVATDSAPGELAGAVYVLTVQATGATGNGNVTHAALRAELRP